MEIQVGELIKKAKVSRCGNGDYPVLSMTMHDGLMFQNDRFKKQIASVDQSNYQVVKRHQLVESFPIDEGVLAVQELTEEGIVSPAYKIWDVNMDRVIPVYLELALRSPRSIEYYKSKLRGTTARRRSITDAEFCAMQIKLPDLKEQERIIKLISRARAVSAKRQQELDTLDELIKARFVELFGDPRSNPNGLSIKTLDQLGEWKSGGTPSRNNPDYFTGNINWYSAGELNSLYLDGSIEKITEEAIKESAAKMFKSGSMLVGMYDTAAFKMGILKEDSASNQACACIEPNESVDIVWLYYALSMMKDHFLSQRRGVRQKNLNLGMIRGFELPVSSKTEQMEFVEFVKQVDKSKVVAWVTTRIRPLKKELWH